MTAIVGTNISAPVVPYTTEDAYPTHVDSYGKGGWRGVETHDDLALIPQARLSDGMSVFVRESGLVYVYSAEDASFVLFTNFNSFLSTLVFATWAECHGYHAAHPETALLSGFGARVVADAGQHVDPVSNQNVANEGIYRWSTAVSDFERVANLEVSDVLGLKQDVEAARSETLAARDQAVVGIADSQFGEVCHLNFFSDADMEGQRVLWSGSADLPTVAVNGHRALRFTNQQTRGITSYFPDGLAVGAPFVQSIRLEASNYVSGGVSVIGIYQVDASGNALTPATFLYGAGETTATPSTLTHSSARMDGAVGIRLYVTTSGNPANSLTLSLGDAHEGTSTTYRARLRGHFTTVEEVERVREQVQGGVPSLLVAAGTTAGHLLDPATGQVGGANGQFTVLNAASTHGGEQMIADKNLYNAAWLTGNGEWRFGLGFAGEPNFALPAGTAWRTPPGCSQFVADILTADIPTLKWVRGNVIPDALLPVSENVNSARAVALAGEVLDDALIARPNRFNKRALDVLPGKLMNAATGQPGGDYAQFTMTGWMDCRPNKPLAPSCDCLNVTYAGPDGAIVASQEFNGAVNNPGMAASLFTATTTNGSSTMTVTAILAGAMPYYTQPLFGPGMPVGAQVGSPVTSPSRGVFTFPIWVNNVPTNATATAPTGGSAITGGRTFLPPARATKFRTTIETSKLDTAMFSEGLYTAPYKSFGLAAQPTAAMAAMRPGMHADSLGDFARKLSEGGNGGFGDDLPALAGCRDWAYYFAVFGQKTGDDNVQLTAAALANVDVMILERIANDSGKGATGAPSPMGSITDAAYLGDAPAPAGTSFVSRTKGEIERCQRANPRMKILGITNGIRIRKGQLAYANYADGPLDTSGWIDEWGSNESNPLGFTQIDYANMKIDIFKLYGWPCIDFASESGENFLNAGLFSSDGVHKNRAWNTFCVNPRIVAALNTLVR